MKALCINGVDSNGEHNIDILGGKLENLGHEHIDCNYRITRLFRFQTYDQGRQFEDAQYIGRNYYDLNNCTPEDTILIGHSRGGLVAWRMLELGYRFKAVFLFRPAMNKDFILPRGQDNVYCIHSPHDKAIKWGSYLPFNDFGDAGRYGLDDERVINVEAPEYDNADFLRHSEDFLEPQVTNWARYIDRKLELL